MSDTVTIQICPEGDLIQLFIPPARILLDFGATVIRHNGAGWMADMSTLGWPILGPFDTRMEALEAEAKYLTECAESNQLFGSLN